MRRTLLRGKTFASCCLKHWTLARLEQQIAARAGQIACVYLRAAQAYMLISMPTGTSTIFGVFQVIRVSQVVWREVRAGVEPRSSRRRNASSMDRYPNDVVSRLMSNTSLLDKSISLLD